MKTVLITTASDPNHKGWLQFKRSLDYFGWDYHLIVHEYIGFNSKIVAFYNYLIENSDITHFIYADSYDSFVLSAQKEVEDKFTNWEGLTYSVEKACWPYEEWAELYPESPYPHKYLNGGGFMGSSAAFIKMYEANPIWESGAQNDQVWAQNEYLRRNDGSIKLDTGSNIFQPIAHSDEDDFLQFTYEFKGVSYGRIINMHTKTMPVIIHGNGHTPMDDIYKLLK